MTRRRIANIMRTIWQSLAWKEWHEHKWKLAALLAIMWGVAMLSADRNGTTERFSESGSSLAIGIVPLAIFIGLGTAAGERSRGTMPFLQALPVPMWRVALHKLAFGLVTIILPALLTSGDLHTLGADASTCSASNTAP